MGAQAVRLSNVDIDNALKEKDFEVLYQPIFDLGNGALARVESFVRWRHPKLGVLPPGAFISFFENQGRMSELTRYVLGAALAGYGGWRGPFAPGFSINLALSDFSDESFSTHFVKLLRDREFPADLITLECPMPAVDADLAQASEHFARLRQTGARLAIEVRGQANDFLRNIDPFPFDEIKTGGSSILRFARTVRGPGLSAISDLLDIAGGANAAITAVGVEDQASLAALRGLGFTAAQGNHLAKVGALSDFRPGRVNDVRALLGLSALSQDDLASLFRTTAPEPKAARPEESGDAPDGSAPEADQDGETASSTGAADQALRARAREKAKALALAKRARERAARKTAAIERAKAKAAASQDDAGAPATAAHPAAPRDLQERLALEFKEPASKDAIDSDGPMTTTHPSDPPAGDDAEAAAIAPEKDQNALESPAAAREDPAPAQGAPEDEVKTPAPVATPQPPAAAPIAPSSVEPFGNIRLAVGAARAYFQPGIHVGGQVFNPHMETPTSRQAAAEAAPEHPSPDAARPAPEQTGLDLDLAPATPAKASANDTDQGDLMEDVEQPRAPARRPRNFLTRKYRVRLPNHFWPRSWKRRLRRIRSRSAGTAKAAQ